MKIRVALTSFWRTSLKGVVFSSAFLLMGSTAYCLPTGYTVESGEASFDSSVPNSLTIQASDNAIINFDSFSVAAHETVQFVLPGNQSSVLSRVVGSGASDIFGSLFSSGQLILVNPNGITFHASANIQTASLIASTLDISNAMYLAKNLTFEKSSLVPGKILNEADITASEGGHIALLSEQVENRGTLTAKLGTVILASGEKMTLSLLEGGNVHLVIDRGLAVAKENAVTNTGEIHAAGGRVTLNAKTLNDTLKTLVNNTGVIEANQVIERDGVIELISSGAIKSSGKLEAKGGEVILESSSQSRLGSVEADKLTLKTPSEADYIQELASEVTLGTLKIGPQITVHAQDTFYLISKDWINEGSFLGDLSTVELKTLNPSQVTGDNTFHNFVILEPGKQVTFESGKTQTITGNLALGGSDGKPLILKSSILSTEWKIEATGAVEITYLDVLDQGSIRIHGPPQEDSHVYVLGNNTFYSLTIDSPDREVYFQAGKTQTILGKLTVIGAPDQGPEEYFIKLRSTNPGQHWYLDIQGTTPFLDLVNVQDLYAVNFLFIEHGANAGNNFNILIDPTWDGGGGDNNWSTGDNWSGNVVPATTDAVLFDGTSTKDATIDNVGTWSGGTFTIAAGYTGTITQNVDMTTAAFSQATGTFTGGASALDVNGNFSLTGGIFTAPSGSFTVNGNWSRTAGTFTPGTNTVTFDATDNDNTIGMAGASFYNLAFNGVGGIWSATGDISVSNNMTVTTGTFQTAKDTSGNVTVTATLLVDTNGIFIVRRSSTTGNGAGQTITAGTLTITGTMQANSQGFAGGTWTLGSGPGGGGGSNSCGCSRGAGGGYGGTGGNSSAPVTGGSPYGSATNPVSLGSGGGYGNANGGAGAGAIILSVGGTLTVTGTLSANGANGIAAGGGTAYGGGGGAGGSINITAGTLAGAGTISATGGAPGSGGAGGGGGGRVDLSAVTTYSFTGTLTVAGGGTDRYRGYSGTVDFPTNFSLTIPVAKTWRIGYDGSNAYDFGSGTLTIDGTLEIDGNPTANGNTGGSATISAANINIANGGTLTANSLGFGGGIVTTGGGPGGGGGSNGCGCSRGAGAGYGGAGGNSSTPVTGGSPYGSVTNPVSLGSGGGYGAANGGAGGGAIILSVSNTFTVTGTLSANGANGVTAGGGTAYGGGGGAGGSINITAGTLAGAGAISARGGAGGSGGTGGGSGGRIAIVLTSGTTFSTTPTAYGGTAAGRDGAAGTIYLQDANDGANDGELIIDNTGVSATATTILTSSVTGLSVGDVIIRNSGKLEIADGAVNLTVSGNWTNSATQTLTNGTITFDATDTGNTITDGGGNWYNVTFNGAGGDWTFQDSTVISNDLTVTAGSLLGTNDITVNGGDTTDNGTINLTGGTFLLDGAGNFGGNTNWTFSTLTFGNGAGVTTTTKTGSNTINVSSNLTVAASQTLDSGDDTWTVAGDLSISGMLSGIAVITINGGDVTGNGTISLTGGTFLLDGAGNFGGNTDWTFYNLIFGNGAGATTTTKTAGSTGNIIVSNDFTIAANQTFSADDDTYTIGNDWTNSGTFTAGTSSVVFNGGDQVINGSTVFNNLSKTDAANDATSPILTFENSSIFTIEGLLALAGLDTDDLLILVSDSPGTQWILNANGTFAITFVDVTDSDASGGLPIVHTSSMSGGNNLNWGFGGGGIPSNPLGDITDPNNSFFQAVIDALMPSGIAFAAEAPTPPVILIGSSPGAFSGAQGSQNLQPTQMQSIFPGILKGGSMSSGFMITGGHAPFESLMVEMIMPLPESEEDELTSAV